MDICEMTIKEFEALPWREDWAEELECDTLIILPAKINARKYLGWRIQNLLASRFSFIRRMEKYEIDGLHDSGYRCMDFVAVKDGQPICRLSGGSDVVHIDGIGGYGYKWRERGKGVPHKIDVHGWSIDCLPTSGLLRIWPNSARLLCGAAVSSFEIYALSENAIKAKENESGNCGEDNKGQSAPAEREGSPHL